jgi:hypothetical protein
MQEPKQTDNQRKGRRVYINIDEEDFFEMLDHVNPKNIIKYLDMRRIPHRDSLEINVSEVKVNLNHSKHIDRVKHGLYQANVTFASVALKVVETQAECSDIDDPNREFLPVDAIQMRHAIYYLSKFVSLFGPFSAMCETDNPAIKMCKQAFSELEHC